MENREHDDVNDCTDIHVVDRWCYLGTADYEAEQEAILGDRAVASLERDTYLILDKYLRSTARRPDTIDLSHAAQRGVWYAEQQPL